MSKYNGEHDVYIYKERNCIICKAFKEYKIVRKCIASFETCITLLVSKDNIRLLVFFEILQITPKFQGHLFISMHKTLTVSFILFAE